MQERSFLYINTRSLEHLQDLQESDWTAGNWFGRQTEDLPNTFLKKNYIEAF